MSSTQFDTLINAGGYPKLADYLKATYPDKIVATIGEKNYATYTMGGPGSDMRITFGSRNADCDDVPNESTDLTWRGPTGVGVPDYISGPVCGRFYVDADKALDYGTADHLAGLDVPARGQPRRRRHRPRPPRWRHLGDRRGLRGHVPRGLERADADLRRHRQGRPHVGRAERRAAVPRW